MEEQKVNIEEGTRTFTEKEVMDIVSKMQADFSNKVKEYNKAINELNGTLTRLNFLLKIVENATVFSSEFIVKCVSEIEDIMTIPENVDEPNTEE